MADAAAAPEVDPVAQRLGAGGLPAAARRDTVPAWRDGAGQTGRRAPGPCQGNRAEGESSVNESNGTDIRGTVIRSRGIGIPAFPAASPA
jgi:hypothetical protein